MKKFILALISTVLLNVNTTFSQETEIDSLEITYQEVEESLNYQYGTIELPQGNAKLTVPAGFRYLDPEQSMYVLSDLWGNPPDSTVLGLLVPENKGVLEPSGWVFTISYDEMGYVKDDDASEIDYDELLKEQQKEIRDGNEERINLGYPPIDFIGWASHPYYDKDKKVLHWAKELKFGEDTLNTLNYNLRILGRKGIFMLNAVASMNELNEVKSKIDKVIASVEFNEGSRYADFNPDVDEIAAWTLGGLVAGKLLTKVGFFAMLLKFWKVIGISLIAGGGAIWKYFRGKA